MIQAGVRRFELPPFAIGDRVLWTALMPYHKPGPDRLPATVVGINLLAAPGARVQLWFDEDVRGLANGLINGIKCPLDEVEPMPVVDQLAALERSDGA